MKRLAILVPYRDREEHLNKFVPCMEKFLGEKGMDFRILVIEQTPGKPFNKAKLLNIGFDRTRASFDYFCFHDIDMLPESEACDYRWVVRPTHMATFVSQFGYRLPYAGYFGGVTLFNKEDFERINGFSNEYWGWGLEDDDLLRRCVLSGLRPCRRAGQFVSLWHEPNAATTAQGKPSRETAANRRKYFHLANRFQEEGLNSLQYEIKNGREIFGRHETVTVNI